MKKRYILALCIFILLVSCKKKESETSTTPNRGSISLEFDDAFVNVAEALSERYTKTYPETKINLVVSKETQAFKNLIDAKTDAIIMSRPLTANEKSLYRSAVGLDLKPARFGADAITFIVPKTSTRTSISIDEVKAMLSSKGKRFIFEGSYTSNWNALADTLKIKKSTMQYSTVRGNENIVKSLEEFPDHIGVISYNTISRPFGGKAQKLRENIRILPIKVGEKEIFPTRASMKNGSYPFTKILYFLTNEGHFGLANGLIRYSCTQLGQMVVDKQGLQPYYTYPRTVQIAL